MKEGDEDSSAWRRSDWSTLSRGFLSFTFFSPSLSSLSSLLFLLLFFSSSLLLIFFSSSHLLIFFSSSHLLIFSSLQPQTTKVRVPFLFFFSFFLILQLFLHFFVFNSSSIFSSSFLLFSFSST
jgi:hypothetical protein